MTPYRQIQNNNPDLYERQPTRQDTEYKMNYCMILSSKLDITGEAEEKAVNNYKKYKEQWLRENGYYDS